MDVYHFPQQTQFYQGKVRDVYTIAPDLLIMIASNRISAFDVILPSPIPFKGQVLNQIAAYMLEATNDICPNWLIAAPTPNSSIGYQCQPFKIEMVVRGNLCGHAWRTHQSGATELCGVRLPKGMRENDFFESPIITPSTKAAVGHDEDITAAEILAQNLLTEEEWSIVKTYALKLFERGQKIARQRGLILADTKYEFGKINDTITLMDEIHTPDSSRYFYLDGFEERQKKAEKQLQLSKEFVREWLISKNFMGKEGQIIPTMTDEWVNTISEKYITLYEKITGQKFIPIQLSETKNFEQIKAALAVLTI